MAIHIIIFIFIIIILIIIIVVVVAVAVLSFVLVQYSPRWKRLARSPFCWLFWWRRFFSWWTFQSLQTRPRLSHWERDPPTCGRYGNIFTDENGNVVGDWFFDMMRFSGEASVVGRSILLFQDPDVCTTMAAGYRWGWGILGICDSDCQDKYVHNSTAGYCFPEDWDCGDGIVMPYDCCAGLKCAIYDEENQVGTCVIDPGMERPAGV